MSNSASWPELVLKHHFFASLCIIFSIFYLTAQLFPDCKSWFWGIREAVVWKWPRGGRNRFLTPLYQLDWKKRARWVFQKKKYVDEKYLEKILFLVGREYGGSTVSEKRNISFSFFFRTWTFFIKLRMRMAVTIMMCRGEHFHSSVNWKDLRKECGLNYE